MRSIYTFAACIVALTYSAKADLVTNGGFENGNLSGWTMTATDPVNNGWFADNTTVTPQSGDPTVGPASGKWYAVTDQYGPGSNALSETFTVPLYTTNLQLSFDFFINDFADTVADGGDFKVMILGPGGNVLTGSNAVYTADYGTTLVNGGVPNPYVAVSVNVLPFVTLGGTYTLDFLEQDFTAPNNVGLDNVSLIATPEPGSVALLLSVFALVGARFRRRLV